MTENPDKFREAESILASQGIKIQHLKRTKVEVQDPSLETIARFAVKSAPIHPPGLLVVEDSGLFIDALGGAVTFRLMQGHAPLTTKFANALIKLLLSGCSTKESR